MTSGGPRDYEDSPRPTPKPAPAKGTGDGSGPFVGSPCDIRERTKVNSPDRTVASTLRANDVLRLHYQSGPPRQLLARTKTGQTLGSITSPSMPQVIQCIEAGHAYDVVILAITGGQIDVRIEPA